MSPPEVLLCTLLLTLYRLIGWAGGLQITDMRVPQLVRNGSGRPVVLDCEYTLAPEDEAAGLVVKWFFNSNPAPVYQWIPKQKPQDLGVLKGRLNLEYRASSHPGSMHRALQILEPSTELSGEYKCSVSTFHAEDFMVKRMLVFAPEKRLEMWPSRGPREGLINVTCAATGAFPEPALALFRDPASQLEDIRSETRARDGSYDVTASAVLEEPTEPTAFHCDLSIPAAHYEVRKTLFYYPGSAHLSAEGGSSGGDTRATGRPLMLLLPAMVVVLLLPLAIAMSAGNTLRRSCC